MGEIDPIPPAAGYVNATVAVAVPDALANAVRLLVGAPDWLKTRPRAMVSGEVTVDAAPLHTEVNAVVNRYAFLEFNPSPKKRSSAIDTVLRAEGVYGAAASGVFDGVVKLEPSKFVVI